MSVRMPLSLPETTTVNLNRSERVYVACEGPIGELNQSYLMRYSVPLDEALVRSSFRRLVEAFARLRGVLEPTPRRFCLRILPMDEQLDDLLDLAFRVEHVDVDNPEALRRWHELAMNDPMALQRGLSVRLQFAPHPERGALIMTVHHLLMDGRSMVMLLGAFNRLLNGLPIDDHPVQPPTMLPAILPQHAWQWLGKLKTSWGHFRAHARELASHEIVRLPHRPSSRYLSCGVLHHDTGRPAKEISAAAKGMGGSGNSLLIAAIGTALLDLAGRKPGSAACIRASVDLRRYYPEGQAPVVGNYVAIHDVVLPIDVPESERVRWVDERMREGLRRFEQREKMLPLLPYEMLGWLHAHTYSRLIAKVKREGMASNLSFHVTNIGSVDVLNPESAQVPLAELLPIVPGAVPLAVLVVVNGQQKIVTSHHRDEYADTGMQALMHEVGQVLARWVPAPQA
jgi:Condensation domain